MGFIKKHAFLIVAILVVLLAGGLFVFGMRISSANRKKLKELENRCNQIPSASKLKHNNQIDYIRSVAQERNTKAEALLQSINQVSRRPLLMEDYFPVPSYDIIIYSGRFAESYIGFIDTLLTEMGAGDRPTKLEEDKVRKDYMGSQVGTSANAAANYSYYNMPTPGMPTAPGQPKNPAEELVDALRRKRAESIKLYASSDALFGGQYWNAIREKPEVDDRDAMLRRAWYTQLAAWIQKDVADSLHQVNISSTSVVNAPVKRLVEISFGGDPLSGASGPATGGADTAGIVTRRVADSAMRMPIYVLDPGETSNTTAGGETGAPKTKTYFGQMTRSWTNRASDDLIDVVHFELSVIIDTTAIVDFVNIMQDVKTSEGTRRNQITVLLMNTSPINLRQEEAAGYYYGGGSLAELRMICEYVFFHKGYQDLMPEPVIKDLKPGNPAEGTAGMNFAG